MEPDPGDPDVCTPGIWATSQVPRLLNREYDAVVRDLLGVTNVPNAPTGNPSSLLVSDFEGSMTDIAWNSYLVAAESIAAEVMAGENKSRFIACDPAAVACLESTIRDFGRKAFAYLVGRLDSIDEGEGKLLDNTATAWFQEDSDGNSHNLNNLPIFQAGSCGGYFKTGQAVNVEGGKADLAVSVKR
ncbi:hypothetical protein WMF45_37615 [Sorangium sp. So ce448]|uniref:hypothetical protein n=1 Tax=Sorangium sp. So ce448 TaxID=3133314 RepID=UPI003F5E6879